MPEIRFTEEDHRRINEAVAALDPTGFLMTERIRLFSEEDANWYADSERSSLRGAVISVLLAEALREAIVELGGTIDAHDVRELESQFREMFENERHAGKLSMEHWDRLLAGTSDDATDEDANRHFDAARDTVRKEVV
jgi:hypothetical protein